eukprot:gb/GFBE01014605.1/.p1 GENE.gb/GFBE01014605.1/~~gb/GFBE01014605.1/.p1  ORF type:complete len:122 (+),score=31.73 gb/GFBE01014605.1/:1-366(+)
MRPRGFMPQEKMEEARKELQNLLGYYFPASQERPEQPERLQVSLRVHEEMGAGIDIVPHPGKGLCVEHVEAEPGQDFSAGDVIVEINGQSLVEFGEEAMEDAFGEHFANGAKLTVVRPSKR